MEGLNDTPAPRPLHTLARHLDDAQVALRSAAELCPGMPALQAELLARAAWCREQFQNTVDRIEHGLERRSADRRR